MAPCDSVMPSTVSHHLRMMNCSVAPAPQNRVVTASEIWPSLSRHSVETQWAKSLASRRALRGCLA